MAQEHAQLRSCSLLAGLIIATILSSCTNFGSKQPVLESPASESQVCSGEFPESFGVEPARSVYPPGLAERIESEIRSTNGKLLYNSAVSKKTSRLLKEAIDRNIDLSGADLRNRCLSNRDDEHPERALVTCFLNAKLTNADFSGSELWSDRFIDSDLTGAKFAKAVLIGSLFERCNLQNANFQYCLHGHGSDPINNSFKACGLSGTDFSYASLTRTLFADSDLSGANLSNSNLETSAFVRCNLFHANLRSSYLSQVRFVSVALNQESFDKKIDQFLTLSLTPSLEPTADSYAPPEDEVTPHEQWGVSLFLPKSAHCKGWIVFHSYINIVDSRGKLTVASREKIKDAGPILAGGVWNWEEWEERLGSEIVRTWNPDTGGGYKVQLCVKQNRQITIDAFKHFMPFYIQSQDKCDERPETIRAVKESIENAIRKLNGDPSLDLPPSIDHAYFLVQLFAGLKE